MTDVAVQEQTTATPSLQQSAENISQKLGDIMFGEQVVNQTLNADNNAQSAATKTNNQESSPPPEQEEVVDNITYLKDKFGWDSEETALAELQQLRELKSKEPEKLKFADEQAKQFYELASNGKTKELREFLNTQERLNEVASSEVTKDNAEDIIKLGMSVKNKNLSPQEIDFQYKQDYTAPKEPVQRSVETDEEFAERHEEWKEKVANIEMKRTIAAKMVQPELAQLKSELVLPKINNETQNQTAQPTEQEIAAAQKEVSNFIEFSTKAVNDFEGISTQVKDKDVNYTVKYAISPEEKAFIQNKLTEFAQSDFNPYVLFKEKWLSEDGKTIKVQQIAEDVLRLYYGSKSDQKIASEAANQRLEIFLKQRKNINLNGQNQQGNAQFSSPKTEAEAATEAWLSV